MQDGAIVILAPVHAAAGDVGKLLLGVGLLAASAFLPGTVGLFGVQLSSTTIGLYGAGLFLGSVINWLTPKPPENKASIISPALNSNQGERIALGFGRRFVTPTLISGTSKIEDLSEQRTRGNGGFLGIGGWSETYTYGRSRARIQLIDGLCAGEIGGLVTGDERSIWVNGTPLKSPSGDWNFQGVLAVQFRNGDPSESSLPSPWDKVCREVEVNRKLTQSIGAVTRRIDRSKAANISSIRIRLFWERCLRTNDGDNAAAWTSHKIWLKEGSGAWQLRGDYSHYFWNSSSFERDYEISVNPAEYYEIRVERSRPDDDNAGNTLSTAYWKSFTTVVNLRFKWPTLSKTALDIDLEKFGTTDLTRYYHLNLHKIQIPSNATVRADGSLQYTGLWNGAFNPVLQWSTDPAWCQYHAAINGVDGGGIPAEYLDKFAFYSCSKYCAELIPDGYGNTEPRFTLNCLFTDKESVYAGLQKISNAFQSMLFYQTGQMTPDCDRPKDPSQIFNNSNATFSYVGTPYRNRRNRAVVRYTRPEAPNEVDFEIWEDKDDILKRGIEELEIDASFYCTSRGLALRIAKWAIYTEQRQRESIAIQTGMAGALVRPGDVISVGDSDRAGLRRWGRIISATSNSVQIDYPVSLPIGSHTLSVQLPNGAIESRSIASVSASTISVLPVFSQAPEPEAAWAISSFDVQPTQYRVISVAEPEVYRYEILGLLHEPSKYSAIEQGTNFIEPPAPLSPPVPPLPPSGIILTPYYGIGLSLGATWSPPTPSTYTTGYQIQYRNLIDPLATASTTAPSYLISPAKYGDYEVSIRAQSATGAYSSWLLETIEIPVIANLSAAVQGSEAASVALLPPSTFGEFVQIAPESASRIVLLN